LFKNLSTDSKTLNSKTSSQTKRDDPASRKKGRAKKEDVTKSITSSLVAKINKIKKIKFISTSSGKFDPYFSKIATILNKEWQQFIGIDERAKAKAIISIDNNGNFNYQKPYLLDESEKFNALLLKFLEKMKHRKFPIHNRGELVEFNIIFGTK